jgi:hypothetical protein
MEQVAGKKHAGCFFKQQSGEGEVERASSRTFDLGLLAVPQNRRKSSRL